MRCRFLFLILSFLINETTLAQNKVDLPASFGKIISGELKPFYSLSEGQIEDLLKGGVISVGSVETPSSKEQKMMMFASGVHPRNCVRAMRKLSLYENYRQYVSFIKESTYDDKTERISFLIDHSLLPFQMSLRFKIPRITKAGVYPFTFEEGFLKGLKGNIVVKDINKFCSLSLKADWRGPDSKIPDLILGTFVQTVGKLGLEHLIRVSLF